MHNNINLYGLFQKLCFSETLKCNDWHEKIGYQLKVVAHIVIFVCFMLNLSTCNHMIFMINRDLNGY